MCKVSQPKPPPVVVRDPVKEAADAANEAAGKANMELATKRKRRRESSLLTVGAQGSGVSGNSLLQMAQPVA